jgi:hypothetical protein
LNKNKNNNLLQSKLKQEEPEPEPEEMLFELSTDSYQIISKKEKRCIAAGYHGQGGGLVLESCALGKSAQLFRKITHMNGEVQFLSDLTNMVVEIECASMNEEAPLREWPDTNETHQKFRVEFTTDENFNLVSDQSSLCLDSSYRDKVNQKLCEPGNEYQEWFLRVYKMEAPVEGFFSIKNTPSGRCLSINNNNSEIKDCSPTDLSEYFRFIQNKDGSMFISREDGLVLANPRDVGLTVEKNTNSYHQGWYLDPISDTTVSVVNRDSTKCLSFPDGSANSDAVDCVAGDPTQEFEFVPMELGIIPEIGYTAFIHVASEKCIRYTSENRPLEIADCIDANQFQTFKLEFQPNGSYMIISQTKQVISNENNDRRNDNPAVIYNYMDHENNQWFLVPAGNNEFYIKSRLNESRCMNLEGSTDNGSTIRTSDCNDNPDFKFILKSIELTPPEEEIYYTITSVKHDKCLTTRLFRNPIQINTCNNADLSQLFKFKLLDDRSFAIRHYGGGLVDSGDHIKTYHQNYGGPQRFYVYSVTQDTFRFVSLYLHDHCITVTDNNGDYDDIDIAPCEEGSEYQQFKITEAEYTPELSTQIAIKNEIGTCMKPKFETNRLLMTDCDQEDGMFAFSKVYNDSDGTYNIEHLTRWCIDNLSDSGSEGNPTGINKCGQGSHLGWYFAPNTDDSYHIIIARYPKMCVQVTEDDNLAIYECDLENGLQRFRSIPVSLKPVPTEFVSFVSKSDSKCLTNIQGPPQHSDCNPEITNRQGWKFVINGDGSYSIYNPVNFALFSNTQIIELQKADPTVDDQKWNVLPIDDTYFYIIHVLSHKCLDDNEGYANLKHCDHNDRQKFSFKPVQVFDMRPGWHMIKHTVTGKCLRNVLEKIIIYGDCDPNDDSYVYYIMSISALLSIKTITGHPLMIREAEQAIESANRINEEIMSGMLDSINGLNAIQEAAQGKYNAIGGEWSFYPGKFMTFNIKNRSDNKCVKIDESIPEPYLTDCDFEEADQTFELIQKGRIPLPTDYVQIVNVHTKKCIKAVENSQPIIQVDCGDQSDRNTFFKIGKAQEGGFRFETVDGQCLDYNSKVYTFTKTDNKFQSFLISPYGNYYMLVNVEKRHCFEPDSEDNDVNYTPMNCNFVESQYYYFVPVLENNAQ